MRLLPNRGSCSLTGSPQAHAKKCHTLNGKFYFETAHPLFKEVDSGTMQGSWDLKVCGNYGDRDGQQVSKMDLRKEPFRDLFFMRRTV